MDSHVAIFAFPFGTHVPVLYDLARALATAAPSAIFSFVSTAKTLQSLPQTPPTNLNLLSFEEEISDSDKSSYGLQERGHMFLHSALGKVKAAAKAAAKGAGGVQVSCVVSDAFMWMADVVAQEIGVPWVAVFIGIPFAFLAHFYTDELRSHFETQDQAILTHSDTLLDFIPGLATMRVRDLPEGVLFGDLNSKFSLNLIDTVHRLPKAAAVVLLTLPGLQSDSIFPTALNQILLISPLQLMTISPPISTPDKENCLPWLDSQTPSSVIYVAFGRVTALAAVELAELAHGLEISNAPFLWSISEEMQLNLPEGFVERTRLRGKLVNWAPQVRVLRHAAVGVYVTHSGWISTMESIMARVVMICRPSFADQKMVARLAESVLGVGINLDCGIEREGFVRAVDGVLKGDEGERMRKRVVEISEAAEKAGGKFLENFKSLVELVCGK